MFGRNGREEGRTVATCLAVAAATTGNDGIQRNAICFATCFATTTNDTTIVTAAYRRKHRLKTQRRLLEPPTK